MELARGRCAYRGSLALETRPACQSHGRKLAGGVVALSMSDVDTVEGAMN
jgi:hypothetical protein